MSDNENTEFNAVEQVDPTTNGVEDQDLTTSKVLADEQATAEEVNDVEVNEPVDEHPDTFPREYVEELREENKRYRLRAQQTDELAARLHTALVNADGRLHDAADLPFNEEHLDNPERLKMAIDDLIETKPHLKKRRVTGDIGAGERGKPTGGVDLIGLIRGMQ